MNRIHHTTPIFNRAFVHPSDGMYMIEPRGQHPNKRAGVIQILDKTACESITNRFNAAAAQPGFAGMLVDHEHFAQENDQESRAYGWLMRLENRDDGIYGEIRWTTTGKAAVDGGDYRFFSTEYDPDDLTVLNDGKPAQVRPMSLDGLTLTNVPNNKGGKPITNRKNMKRVNNDASDDDAGEEMMNSATMSEAANSKSTKADAATETATASDDKEDHLKAAKANTTASRAHAKAGDAASDAGNEETAKSHYEQAADHASQASDHLDACANCDATMKNRICNGDYPGHPFHGNQHTGGEGSSKASESSRKANDASKEAKTGGAKAQAKAAVAHTKAAAAQEKAGNENAAAYHKSMASHHMGQAAKGSNVDFKERKEKKGSQNREEFRRDDAADNNQGKKMRSVCTELGLSADASEDSVLNEVLKLKNRAKDTETVAAPLRNRVAALEAENKQFIDEQIAADLDARGIKDEKLRNRFTAIIKPLANRKERLECLDDIAPRGRAVSGQQKLNNRDTTPPGTSAITDETNTRDANIQAQKITNRAKAIRAENPKLSLATSFVLAQNESKLENA